MTVSPPTWMGVIIALCMGCFVGGCSKPPARVVADESGVCLADGGMANFPIDGSNEDLIRSEFNGFGCNSIAQIGTVRAIHLRPMAAKSSSETHASLVLGTEWKGAIHLSVGIQTIHQTRIDSLPGPHEVGWLVWNYRDKEHFYYLVAKPNGWELGKRDPAFLGGQRFLATGNVPNFAIGIRHLLEVVQKDAIIRAKIDGVAVTEFKDDQNPYLGGQIGVYSEDAEVYFDSLAVNRP